VACILPLAILALAGCASSAAIVDPSSPVIAFINVSVVDPESDSLQRDMSVLVNGNRIMAVRPASAGPPPRGATVIDGRGKYLMPGLWDAHVHVMTGPDSGLGMIERARDRFFPQFLTYGVTSIRDMGSYGDSMEVLRGKIRDGAILGPRIIAGGRLIAGLNPWAPPSPHSILVTSPDSARAAVEQVRAEGGDFIKAHDMLSRAAFLEVAAAAREARLPLVGHLRPSVTVEEAIAAGQVGIEHTPVELMAACGPGDARAASNAWYQAWIADGWRAHIEGMVELWGRREEAQCRRVLALLRDAGVHITPTTVLRMQDSVFAIRTGPPLTRTAESAKQCASDSTVWYDLPAELRASYARTLDSFVGHLYREGIEIMAGSDGPGGCLTPGAALHEELRALVRAGLTPRQAIRAATTVPARFAGVGDSVGTVGAGKVADLVLLGQNPLLDIENTRSIEAVMLGGRLLRRDELLVAPPLPGGLRR
jgi:imidazolonepropionase-like amidohydrolase